MVKVGVGRILAPGKPPRRHIGFQRGAGNAQSGRIRLPDNGRMAASPSGPQPCAQVQQQRFGLVLPLVCQRDFVRAAACRRLFQKGIARPPRGIFQACAPCARQRGNVAPALYAFHAQRPAQAAHKARVLARRLAPDAVIVVRADQREAHGGFQRVQHQQQRTESAPPDTAASTRSPGRTRWCAAKARGRSAPPGQNLPSSCLVLYPFCRAAATKKKKIRKKICKHRKAAAASAESRSPARPEEARPGTGGGPRGPSVPDPRARRFPRPDAGRLTAPRVRTYAEAEAIPMQILIRWRRYAPYAPGSPGPRARPRRAAGSAIMKPPCRTRVPHPKSSCRFPAARRTAWRRLRFPARRCR